MVQTFDLTPTQSSASMIGNAIGTGISKNFVPPEQQVQRNQLKKALQEAKMAVKQPGSSPLDKIFAFMEAGAGIPGSERYLGSVLPLVQQLAQAEATQNAPFGVGGGMPQDQIQSGMNQGQAPQQRATPEQALQNFLQPEQQNQFYPSNVGEQQAPGNLPQAATSGIKQPVASNQQLLQWAKPYAAQKTQSGIPTTPAQAYEELKALNQDNKDANTLVETERKERVASQREYGRIAEEKLNNVLPDAGDEEKAYIKKQVEQLAGKNASEADIERLAAGEARKYKNMISKVEKDIPAARIYNRPLQDLLGTSKSAQSARNDLKVKLQPLLDAGLYDKARTLLAKQGYYPEEREMTISNLGENSLKTVNRMAEMHTPASVALEDGYAKSDVEMFKKNLDEVLKSDPSTNLILLRRKYELEKEVNWRLFKDSLNEAIDEGTFKPNDDQFNQLNTLDQPPLNKLDKILHGLGLIGR